MSDENKTTYEVLSPIAFKGSSFDRGEEVAMTEAEAQNIGFQYLKPTNAMSEESKQPDDTISGSEDGEQIDPESAPKTSGDDTNTETDGEDTPQNEEDITPEEEVAEHSAPVN